MYGQFGFFLKRKASNPHFAKAPTRKENVFCRPTRRASDIRIIIQHKCQAFKQFSQATISTNNHNKEYSCVSLNPDKGKETMYEMRTQPKLFQNCKNTKLSKRPEKDSYFYLHFSVFVPFSFCLLFKLIYLFIYFIFIYLFIYLFIN